MRHVAISLSLLAAPAPALVAPVALAARPRPAKIDPSTPGELAISSVNQGATLEVDGRTIGQLPLEDTLALLPGAHRVRLTLRGYKPFEATVDIAPGETLELEADLLPFAGIVRIHSTPEGASVSVDGEPRGLTPFDEDVPAGDRTFLIRLPDHEDTVRTVTLAPTQRYDFEFALRPIAKAAPPAVAEGPAFYRTWWFWTLVGVAGAGAATAAVMSSGGEARPLVADLTLAIP
jgi:hypothetical protein